MTRPRGSCLRRTRGRQCQKRGLQATTDGSLRKRWRRRWLRWSSFRRNISRASIWKRSRSFWQPALCPKRSICISRRRSAACFPILIPGSFTKSTASGTGKAEAYRPAAKQSAGGVPALRKRNERPSQLIVVVSFLRPVQIVRLGHKNLVRSKLDGRSHAIQQALKFNFAHGALRVYERALSQMYFVSRLNGLLKLYGIDDRSSVGYQSIGSIRELIPTVCSLTICSLPP